MIDFISNDRFSNYYEVLRVRPYDPPELIQAAFVVQIKQWHPDKFAEADSLTKINAEERTKLIIAAKRILLTPSLKESYDKAFETRFPRRWEKLINKARPSQRSFTVEDLLQNGLPINPNVAHSTSTEFQKFEWLTFSTRVNFKTKRVIFSVSHFLSRNPNCEVRFKFKYNTDWTPFSKQAMYSFSFSDEVALVEMQARHIHSSGKIYYSDRIFKVVVLGDYHQAMKRKSEIISAQNKLKNRLALKLIIILVGSALFSAEMLGMLSSMR